MGKPTPPPRRSRSARAWILLGIVAPLGMVAVCTMMLLELRQDAWDKAEQTSRNLLQVIERDIDRNVEIIDLALRACLRTKPQAGLLRALAAMRQATQARRPVATSRRPARSRSRPPQWPSQPKVRSTTQRRFSTTNPF